MKFLASLVALFLLTAACGGGVEVSGPGGDAARTPTTEADVSSDGVVTGQTAPAEVGEDTKVLAAYLSRVADINVNLLQASADIGLDGDVRPLADAWATAAQAFTELSPPPEGADLQAQWLALTRGFADATADFADAESGSPSEVQQAADAFVEASAKLAPDAVEADVAFVELAGPVLRAGGTEEQLYLAEVGDINAEAAPVAGEIFEVLGTGAPDVDAFLAIFNELGALSDQLEALDPPQSLQDLHDTRLDLFAELDWMGGALDGMLRRGTQPDFDTLTRIQQFSADSQAFAVDFQRAFAEQLRVIATS